MLNINKTRVSKQFIKIKKHKKKPLSVFFFYEYRAQKIKKKEEKLVKNYVRLSTGGNRIIYVKNQHKKNNRKTRQTFREYHVNMLSTVDQRPQWTKGFHILTSDYIQTKSKLRVISSSSSPCASICASGNENEFEKCCSILSQFYVDTYSVVLVL